MAVFKAMDCKMEKRIQPIYWTARMHFNLTKDGMGTMQSFSISGSGMTPEKAILDLYDKFTKVEK